MIPARTAEAIRAAEKLFRQARFEQLRGNFETAELLRDRAEAIYQALDNQVTPAQPDQTSERPAECV